jgi:hypothetical protein
MNYDSSLIFREKGLSLFTRFLNGGRAKIANFCSSTIQKSCFLPEKNLRFFSGTTNATSHSHTISVAHFDCENDSKML